MMYSIHLHNSHVLFETASPGMQTGCMPNLDSH